MKSAARDGLIEFLPMLCVSNSPLLTEKHRKILNQALGNRDKPLQLAILKALEQIGDPSSLPAVQEILDFPYADSYRDLQESASQCIGFIRMNSDEVQNAQTLLRASHYTENQDELLRPAYHTDDAPANELLRPNNKPDGE
ncbi:MAG: HEAT repeat domain-containing protein [Armatimonadetes bacterium]|nr:HEAT repeat domain-containing protein [Armatimonadota bacterium]